MAVRHSIVSKNYYDYSPARPTQRLWQGYVLVHWRGANIIAVVLLLFVFVNHIQVCVFKLSFKSPGGPQ